MAPKTRKKGSGAGAGAGADLPGLFPAHDGSYGVNTLINIDAEAKKGHKFNTGIAKEQSDDKKWIKSMQGKVPKKYGMNSNLKKAIDESHKEVEEETRGGQTPTPKKRSRGSRPGLSNPLGSSSPHSFNGRPGEPSGSPELTPYVPNYNLNDAPFLEEYDGRPRPPYKRPELPLDDPYAHGVGQPVSPLSEDIPFYGLPQGEGSKEPINIARPDSPRSFNYENGLFAKAKLQIPSQLSALLGAPQATAQTFGLAAQNLRAAQPTLQSQPSLKGKSNLGTQVDTPEQSNSSEQTTSSEQTSSEQVSSEQISSEQAAKDQASSEKFWMKKKWKEEPIPSWQPFDGGTTPLALNPIVSNGSFLPPTTLDLPDTELETLGQSPTDTMELLAERAPQSGRNTATQRPTRIGSNIPRRRGLIWPSLDLIIRSIALFSVLALVLWYTLSAIPGGFGDNDMYTSPSHTHFSFPDVNMGALWSAISDLLPEIPDMHSIPRHYPHSAPKGPGPNMNSDDLLGDLKNQIPESVWVRKDKSGNLRISEDFWRALKALIEEDDSILSLKDSDINEDHWRAIESRILRSPALKMGTSAHEMEVLVERSISRSWDSWVGQNNQALKQAIAGVALTKDEFMNLFQQEVTSYQHQITEEITKLQERISGFTQHMTRLQDKVESTDGAMKHEITGIIDSLVSKAVSNMKLDAIAQGLIQGHVNNVLANQLNFFGIGSGVTIDAKLSSPPWDIPKSLPKSKKWLDKDSFKARPRMTALAPWTEEGECFCAGPDLKGFGKGTNNLSVVVSRDIIPQHLVVEHILPGATLDPGAMPKDIEIWMEIEEITLRRELRIFFEAHFPKTPEEEAPHDGFVKIGHFTYENKTSGDGVQVFKISDELTRMSATTNHVFIRALNNYGADHTCFYRLRLYGDVVERPGELPASTK